MTALLAAASVCAAGAVVGMALAGSPAAAAEIGAENGVHAVPSGEVDIAALAKVGAPAAIAAPAPLPVPAPIRAPEPLAVPDAAPAAQALAVADDTPGPEEDAVYRVAAHPDTAPSVSSAGRNAAARLTPVSYDQPAPPSSIGQHVAFPRRSAEAAAAFDDYMHAAAAIDAGFKSGQGVAAALRRASAYDARQLEEGMIAYGAMAAMQSPRFVYGIMDVAANPDRRRALIESLIADPQYAARLPGADEASNLASGAILAEAQPVVQAGRAIKQASYDVQHQGWSIVKAPDQPGRLAEAKAVSAVRASARAGEMEHLLTQVSTLGGQPRSSGVGVSPVAAHSLALAALAILDGTETPDRLEPVLSETNSAECLKMAKLNLFQCLSVAGPEYEDVYCLGQHAVLDTGQCVAGSAAPAAAILLSEGPRMSRRPD